VNLAALPARPALPVRPAPHRKRLHALWRSAGWPCRDALELDLLAAGLLERQWDAEGRETLRVTDAGLQALAAALQRAQAALSAHEALVARVALAMQRAGRIVWRGLALRAALPDDGAAPVPETPAFDAMPPAPAPAARVRWVTARPDVFSIRHTTREDRLEPIVHEVKVSRADLLADLKRPDKARAYAAMAGECSYVVRAGLCRPDELPPAYGLIAAHDDGTLEVLRPATRQPWRPGLDWWMTLARATPEPAEDSAQGCLMPAGPAEPADWAWPAWPSGPSGPDGPNRPEDGRPAAALPDGAMPAPR